MNVTDLPRPSARALYDEAMTRYAELVSPRALAVYRAGRIRHPGLSDIDLIVVTDRTAIDNRHYFSAIERLPQRYAPLFLHEPYILPAWSLRVMQHTTHAAPALLAGRDVLQPYAPDNSSAERWCRMLASYCRYAQFAGEVRATKELPGRRTVSAAGSYCHMLADAAHVFPVEDCEAYEREIDHLCGSFFDYKDPAAAVRDIWNLFAAHFDRFDRALRAHLGTATTPETIQAALRLLRGDDESADFDREYAFRRARDIDGYHQELASLGFPYGQLFFTAAHPRAVRALPEPAVVTNLMRNFYRVRRRLSEYAGA